MSVQNFIVGVIIIIATLYVFVALWRAIKRIDRPSKCHGCDKNSGCSGC